MSIRGGQLIHDVRGFVIDRIQTGGVSNFNIPQTAIKELGNYQNVEIVRDIPTLTFDIESLDVSTEIEAIINHKTPSSVTNGQSFDFTQAIPLDVISPIRSNQGAFDIVKGVGIPYLTMASASYRFGVGANATQTYSFQGDTPYYIPGTPKQQSFTMVNGASQTYTLSTTALAYTEAGATRHVLSVCMKNLTNFASQRLFFASDGTTGTGDFTDTTGAFTILADQSANFPASSSVVEVIYGTATGVNYTAAVNEGVSVKPGALRGKDIHVKVWTGAATPVAVSWSGVQSIQADWKANLQADDELGNPNHVEYTYDIPDVTGNIVVRSKNPQDLQNKIAQIANVGTGVVASYTTSVGCQVDIILKDPDTGTTLKTIYVPDARFTLPALQGKVDSKLDVTFNFQSDTGSMLVYKGDRV